MANEETNKTVEEELAVINERVEEIDKEAEEHSNKLAKLVKSLEVANNALTVIGVSLVVGTVIKESMK